MLNTESQIRLCTLSVTSTNIPPNISARQEGNLSLMGAGTEPSTEARLWFTEMLSKHQLTGGVMHFFVFNLLPTFPFFFLKRLTKTLCLARSLSSIAYQYYTPSNSFSGQESLLDIGWSHLIYCYIQGSPFPTLSVPIFFFSLSFYGFDQYDLIQ